MKSKTSVISAGSSGCAPSERVVLSAVVPSSSRTATIMCSARLAVLATPESFFAVYVYPKRLNQRRMWLVRKFRTQCELVVVTYRNS